MLVPIDHITENALASQLSLAGNPAAFCDPTPARDCYLAPVSCPLPTTGLEYFVLSDHQELTNFISMN